MRPSHAVGYGGAGTGHHPGACAAVDSAGARRGTAHRADAAGAGAQRSSVSRQASAAQDDESTSLEDAIGGRLMLWVGAIVLVLGVAFFLKYAFDNEWITESMRVALGVLAGAA